MKHPHPIHVNEHHHLYVDNLWRVHERLEKTAVRDRDALTLIRQHDSPTTFFYLDPPYPNRAFIGAKEKYTTEDLMQLIGVLKGVKGKFALSLGTEHIKLLPKSWHVRRMLVRRGITGYNDTMNRAYQYEIVATNYNHLPKLKQPAKHRAKYPEPETLLYR